MANMQIQIDPSNETALRNVNRRKGDISKHVNLALKAYFELKPKAFSDIAFEDLVLPKPRV